MNGQWKYLHTIDGRPAIYQAGKQIVFLANGMQLTFASSIEQIRSEQRATLAWRTKRGITEAPYALDYIRVKG